MSQTVSNQRIKRGKEIEEHLNNLNLEPWVFVYEKNVKQKKRFRRGCQSQMISTKSLMEK